MSATGIVRSCTIATIVLAAAGLTGCATTSTIPHRAKLVGEARFNERSTTLRESDMPALQGIAETLSASKDTPVTLTGHAYDYESGARNMARARDRAQAVAAYLIGKGVDPARITIDSRGDTDPPIPIEDLAARKRGNRVEIYAIEPPKSETSK